MSGGGGYRNTWSKLDSEQVGTKPVLKEFIPRKQPKISLFSTVSIYGKKKSGKSIFIKWFLQFYKEFYPWYYVFTLTQLNSFYESFIAKNFIIPEFNADTMDLVMERQTVARKKAEEQIRHKEKEKTNPRAVVIWDDYNGKDIRYNGKLAEYYYTSRHFMTLNLFAAQHITLTPPPIRSNTDLVIMFNTDYTDSLEHYWRDFAGKMPKEMFYEMFREATSEPHTFLAINNDPNIEYSEKFFKGKAEMLDEGPEWIVGCAEMWKENIEQLKDIFAGVYIERFKIGHDLADPDGQEVDKCDPPGNPDILSFTTGSKYA